jgi:hypothetical protein
MAFNSPSFSSGATLTLSLVGLKSAILPRHYLVFEVPEGTLGASTAMCTANGIPWLTTFPNRNGDELSHIRVEPTLASTLLPGSNLTIACSPLTVPVTAAEDGLSFRVDSFELVLRQGTMSVPFTSTRYSGRATVTLTGSTESIHDTAIQWRVSAFAKALSPGSAFFFQLPDGFALTDQSKCTFSTTTVLPMTPVYVGALGASGSAAAPDLPWYGLELPSDNTYDGLGRPIDTLTCTTVKFPSYTTSSTRPTRIVQLYLFRGRHITVADDVAVFPTVIASQLSTTRVTLSHPYANAASDITVSFAGLASGYHKADYIALALAPPAAGAAATAAADAPFTFRAPGNVVCAINGVPGAVGVYVNDTLAVSYPGNVPAQADGTVAVTCVDAHLNGARPQLMASAAVFSDAGIKSTSSNVVIPAVEPTPSIFSTTTLVATVNADTGLATIVLTLTPFPTAVAQDDTILLGLPAGWYHYTGAANGVDACALTAETVGVPVTQTAAGVTTFERVDTATTAPTLTSGMGVAEMQAAVATHSWTLQHRVTSGRIAGNAAATLKLTCRNMLTAPLGEKAVKVTAVVGSSVFGRPLFFSQNVVISLVNATKPTTPAVPAEPTTNVTAPVTSAPVTTPALTILSDYLILQLFFPGLARQLTAAEQAALAAAVSRALGQPTSAPVEARPSVVKERVIPASSTSAGGLEVQVAVPLGTATGLATLADVDTGRAALTSARGTIATEVGKAMSGNGGAVEVGYPDGFSLMSSCLSGAKDGKETDVDCGGGGCFPCRIGRQCAAAGDCASGICGGQGLCVSFNPNAQLGANNAASTGAGSASAAWAAAAVTGLLALLAPVVLAAGATPEGADADAATDITAAPAAAADAAASANVDPIVVESATATANTVTVVESVPGTPVTPHMQPPLTLQRQLRLELQQEQGLGGGRLLARQQRASAPDDVTGAAASPGASPRRRSRRLSS